MVYGVLGLADDLGNIEFLPDYSLPVRKIYEDVIRRHAPPTSSSSSRIPDWSVSINRTHLAWPIEYAIVAQFTAAASSEAEFRFKRNGSILEVSGLCVDIVSVVGEVCPNSERQPNLLPHIYKWLTLANISNDASKPNSPTGRTRVDDFWRTTIHKRTKNGFVAPASFSEMFDVWSERRASSAAADISTLPYYVAMRAAIRDRRFFLSESSIMGLGPSGLMRGDMICVLLGCDAPTIIRKEGDHHTFVGETYFHGYMDGNAIQEMNEGKIQLQKFTLH